MSLPVTPHLRIETVHGDTLLVHLRDLPVVVDAKLRRDAFVEVETLRAIRVWLDPDSIDRLYVFDGVALAALHGFRTQQEEREALAKIGVRDDDESDRADHEAQALLRYLHGL